MDYKEARTYLKEVESRGSVLGLTGMKMLLSELGDPQDCLKFIHIAGTNGKGSALAYLSAILKEAGYRVGRYISPTIFSYRERIQVNEEYIGREELAALVETVKEAVGRVTEKGGPHPTVFEVETAVAFLYFVRRQCDIVVLEVGMGGDTDATNVIKTTELAVLMPVSMDHMQFLGGTLAEIAAHKAGIIKPDIAVVCAPQEAEALAVIKKRAGEMRAKLFCVEPSGITDVTYGLEGQRFTYRGYAQLEIPLAGVCQIENAAVAVLAADVLRGLGWKITEEQLRAGLLNTVWRGRFSVISKRPLFIVDGAHNRAGAAALAASVGQYLKGRRITAICGVFQDKEYEEILRIMAPYISRMIAIRTPDNPRALPQEELARTAKKYMGQVQTADTIPEAVDLAFGMADQERDAILSFGSLSFIGDITRTVEEKVRKL